MAAPAEHIVNQVGSDNTQWNLVISSDFGPMDPLYTFNKHSSARKGVIKKAVRSQDAVKFGPNADVVGILDAYHGDPSFPMCDEAKRAMTSAMDDVQEDRMWKFVEADGSFYARTQPKILRELSAEKLFHILDNPTPEIKGVKVKVEDVLVYPYSATCVLEKVLASVSKPRGVILCPEGFYKNNARLAFNAGLSIAPIPINVETGKMHFDKMEEMMEKYSKEGTLSCFLMTIPGNPLVVDYSVEELQKIGHAILKYKIPTIVDSIFFSAVPVDKSIQLGSIEVEFEGKTHLMYDHIVTISGNSKSTRASGPSKFGCLCTGNKVWKEKLNHLMSNLLLQRETTHLARTTLEFCTFEFFDECAKTMMKQQAKANDWIKKLNEKYGEGTIRVVGPNTYSMFSAIALSDKLYEQAGIVDNWQLEDLFLAAGGLDSVSFSFFGCGKMALRINTLCPNKEGYKTEENLDELFVRVDGVINFLTNGGTYEQAVKRIGVDSTVAIANLPK